MYGVCSTDQNGGAGSVSFADGGLAMSLSAKTQRGAEQVTAFSARNGAVPATEQIRVSVRASQLTLQRGR
jgi:hypothetical protein